MTRKRLNYILLASASAAMLISLAETWAQKGDKPGGGGGSTSPSYTIVKLDDATGTMEGFAYDVNGLRLVVGVARNFVTRTEAACCWNVVTTKRSIQSSLHLLNGGDHAWGCNEAGEIVGDENSKAVYWADAGAVKEVARQTNHGFQNAVFDELLTTGFFRCCLGRH